jgi:hypothetical protein
VPESVAGEFGCEKGVAELVVRLGGALEEVEHVRNKRRGGFTVVPRQGRANTRRETRWGREMHTCEGKRSGRWHQDFFVVEDFVDLVRGGCEVGITRVQEQQAAQLDEVVVECCRGLLGVREEMRQPGETQGDGEQVSRVLDKEGSLLSESVWGEPGHREKEGNVEGNGGGEPAEVD